MKAFKQQYLFLSAQEYRMTNDETGEVNEGISLWYVPDDTLDAEEDEEAKERGQVARGKKVAKMALPMKALDKLKIFPAIYDATLEFVTVSQKQQVRLKDIDFVSAVKLTHIQDKPKAS